MLAGLEERLRDRAYGFAHFAEALLYIVVAILLAAGAVAALAGACGAMYHGLRDGKVLTEAFIILEQLLLVLIFVEVLHTVRISIRSQSLSMEPFLIVGMIASVRRVLVITMRAAQLMDEKQSDSAELFRNSMIELGLLGFLILVFVASIFTLRRAHAKIEETVGT